MSESDRQLVMAALGSAVEEIRHQAVRRLPEVFDAVPEEILLQALSDESWRVRKLAAQMIIEGGVGDELLAALVGALGEQDNAGLRNSATEVLIRLGAVARQPLVDLLRQGDRDERKFAADILGRVGDGSTVEVLLEFLNDEEENVRAAVAESLGIIGDRRAVGPLRDALDKGGVLMQMSCLDSLDRLDAEVPLDQLQALARVGPLRPLVYRLMGHQDEEQVVSILLEGLGSPGRSERAAAVRALVDCYRRADRRRQVEIRVAVTRIAEDEICGRLEQMLESTEAEERAAAAVVSGWTGRAEMVSGLLRAAGDERMQDLIREAIEAIGPRSTDRLVEMLDEIGRAGRVLVLELLGRFRRPESLPRILEMCLSQESEVAEAAQAALGSFGSPAVIPTLVDLMGRTSGRAGQGAVRSLVLIGQRFHDEVVDAVRPMLDGEQDSIRRAAAEVLCGVARKSDVDTLAPLLGDEDPGLRAVVIRAVGRVGWGDAVERLRIALADEQPEVRAAAAWALGSRVGPEVEAALRVALGDSDPWVVREALVGLGQSGSDEAAESIVPLIDHPDGSVAIEAVRALNRIGWIEQPERLVRACLHSDPEVVKEVLAGCDRWPEQERIQALTMALDDERWDVRMTAVRKLEVSKTPRDLQILAQRLAREPDELVRESIEGLLRQVGKE
ncbi:MAG: HEAT repeat domain-containing protein [Deltaproteobacteria bacterium]|nr:HEAT repeat domain-containing protein [Deltaproteobacteria bacterium]